MTDNKVAPASPSAANPANPPAAETAKAPAVRKRVPMSTPQQKLQVPEIAGYHLHWFRDDNVGRALQAGYEFVETTELSLHQLGVATDRLVTGNADMGTRVRVIGGQTEQGTPEYGTLMKIRQEWYDEDQAALAARNANIMQTIFTQEKVPGAEQVGRAPAETEDDKALRYVKTALFNRPPRKARTHG